MSRGLTPTQIATITADPMRFAFLVALDFVDTPVYLWSGTGTLTYGGNNYNGVGAIGSVGQAVETRGNRAKNVNLSLVGQGTGIYAAAMADSRQMQGRTATITAAWMNSAFDTVDFGYKLQSLIIDQMLVEDVMGEGETAGIRLTLKCVDELIDMQESSSVYYSDASQRALNPGDTFLRFIATLPNKDIKWAQKVASLNSGNTGRPDGGWKRPWQN